MEEKTLVKTGKINLFFKTALEKNLKNYKKIFNLKFFNLDNSKYKLFLNLSTIKIMLIAQSIKIL